jgi:GNAT superfamily N-acetyltransferase
VPDHPPSARLRIHPAAPADAERTVAMCAALSAAAGLGASPRFTAEAFRRDGFGPDPAFSCLLAEDGDAAMGYALYCHDYDTERLWRRLYLADLYVEPAGRTHGIGRALMAAVAQAGQAEGARALMWGLLASNERARRFYAGIGEEVRDRIATWVGGDAFRSLAAVASGTGGPVLRAATADDAPLLERFLLATAAELGLPPPTGVAARLRADGFGAAPAFTAVIAERAGEPLGHALFWPTYDSEGSRLRGGWLSDLYVVPAARRRGVGLQLMAEVAHRTAARGGSYLRWLVQERNAPARAFFARFAREWHHGFVCLCAGDRFAALAQSGPLPDSGPAIGR